MRSGILVSKFIIGIVVDVLGHVPVKHLKSRGVKWIAASARNFACVWDASQFVVLHPEISLKNFRGCSEPEHRCVSRCQTPAFLFGALLNEGRRLASHKRETQSSCASRDHSFLQKRSPTRTTRYHIVRFHGILLLRLESNVQIRVLASVPQNHLGDFQGRGPSIWRCASPLSGGRRTTSGRSLTLLRQRDGKGLKIQSKTVSGNRCLGLLLYPWIKSRKNH